MYDPTANVRADAKLKQLVLADEQAADDLWEFRNPEPDGKVLPFSQIRAEIPLRWGFTISHDRLLEFYRWFALKRVYDQAAEVERQTMERLAQDPSVSEEEAKTISRKMFRAVVMAKQDIKGHIALEQLEVLKDQAANARDRTALAKERLEFDKDKLSHASRSKIEAGLDALLAEIKGNPKAVELFNQLKLEVRKK